MAWILDENLKSKEGPSEERTIFSLPSDRHTRNWLHLRQKGSASDLWEAAPTSHTDSNYSFSLPRPKETMSTYKSWAITSHRWHTWRLCQKQANAWPGPVAKTHNKILVQVFIWTLSCSICMDGDRGTWVRAAFAVMAAPLDQPQHCDRVIHSSRPNFIRNAPLHLASSSLYPLIRPPHVLIPAPPGWPSIMEPSQLRVTAVIGCNCCSTQPSLSEKENISLDITFSLQLSTSETQAMKWGWFVLRRIASQHPLV